MERIAGFIARRAKLLALLVAVAALLPALFLSRLQLDNSIDVWLSHSSEEYKAYQEFLGKYGNDEFVVVAISGKEIFTQSGLDEIRSLSERLRGSKDIRSVLSITDAVKPKLSDSKMAAARTRIVESPIYKNLAIADDGTVAGVIAQLETMTGAHQRREVAKQIEEAVGETRAQGWTVHLAGPPLMNVALDKASERDARRFLPIAFVLSAIVLLILFRSFFSLFPPLLAVGLTVVATLGLMAGTGHTINMVSVALPTLLWVLALSNSIHIVNRYRAGISEGKEKVAAVKDAVQELFLPCFLASFTTATGFLSLMVSHMKPVSDLGLFAAVGIMISFVINISVIPGLLLILPISRRASAGAAQTVKGMLIAVARFVQNNNRSVLVASAAVFCLCIGTLWLMRAESSILSFFKDDSEIVESYRFISSRLTGLYTVELDAMPANKVMSGEVAGALGDLIHSIETRPDVAKVLSPATMVPLPLLSALSLTEGPLSRFYESDTGSIRISVLVKEMGYTAHDQLVDFIKEQVATLPAGITVSITGIVPLLNNTQQELVRTQIKSFSIALGVIFVVMTIALRSLKLGLVSMFPNILPIMFCFAVMGISHIPLDAATIMIASIAIGIAVDDTVHFMSRYCAERRRGKNRNSAILSTFVQCGPAIVFTSMVAGIGFLVFCLADFKPIVYFGMLTSLTMFTALAGDIIILPACLYSMK